jgi:hypothetical protein
MTGRTANSARRSATWPRPSTRSTGSPPRTERQMIDPNSRRGDLAPKFGHCRRSERVWTEHFPKARTFFYRTTVIRCVCTWRPVTRR